MTTTTANTHLTDNQMLREINETPALQKIWRQLTPDQRRRVLIEAEGDTWHLGELMQDVKEIKQ
jgi:isochorismate hydrolase